MIFQKVGPIGFFFWIPKGSQFGFVTISVL